MQAATPEQVRAGIERNDDGKPERAVSLRRATEAARRGAQAAARNGAARLDWRTCEAIVKQEPFIERCITKQTGDLVKHGFKVVKRGTEEVHPDDDLVQAWLADSEAFSRVRQALVYAHVHRIGGLMEIEWDDDGAPDTPVSESAVPVAAHIIDPVGIRFEKGRKGAEKGVEFLVQERYGEKPVVLHPDRYARFHFHFLGEPFSSVEVAYHACMAKVKGDQGTGEFVFNAGQPKVHAIVKEAKPGEIEDTIEMVNSPDFVRGYVTDERTTFTQLNPVGFDPTPFYAEWKGSAAAAVGVPVALAEGVQAGAVTGSETNLADYHSDLRLVEVVLLQPFFKRLIKGLLGAVDFDIRWNDPPTLPTVESSQRREKAAALNQFIAAGLTKEAAAREAGLKLSPDDFEPDAPVLPPVEPGPGGAPPRETVPRVVPPGAQPPAPAPAAA
ncbi:MAG: hypothetical protein LC623_05490 [Halobacteriales archaeon]|nr:hypothetical protein [Halobacteriales archaeon]